MKKIIVFLPCRKGSERVKNKNIKKFSNIKGGLTHIKLSQLLKVPEVEKIIVSTDDMEVKKIAKSFNNNKIIIDDRPAQLASSETSTDDLINYVPEIIESGTVLWTHVTSPFVDSMAYSKAIDIYFSNKEKKYDSLMSITKLQSYLWNDSGALNYDRGIEKWPRTQTLTPLSVVNSAIFISEIGAYLKYEDRIGEEPYLFELSEKQAFDIDWEFDFEIAELLWNKNEKI